MLGTMRQFLILTLVALVIASCASTRGGSSGRDNSKDVYKKKASSVASEIPANLLPTLLVGVDSCYVFLQPNMKSAFFGPLEIYENIKRLDTQRDWILVWIPRLRISGWVRKHKVYKVAKDDSDQGNVPTKLLSTLSVTKSRVNVRKAATTRASIIFKARRRQEFFLLDEKKGWYQIWIPQIKKKGWVSGKMVVKQRK